MRVRRVRNGRAQIATGVARERTHRLRRVELVSLVLAVVASAVVFVPTLASPGGGLRRGRRAADAPFPAVDRADLERRLASQDPATFAGALDPAVAGALAASGTGETARLPPGSKVALATRFVTLAGVGTVDASVTGPRPARYRLHVVERSGHWRVFTTQRADGATTATTTAGGLLGGADTTTTTSTPATTPAATCQDPGRAMPVLLVHGFADSPEIFEIGSPSLEQTLAAMPGVFVAEPFDYAAVSHDWVDQTDVGPALATRIDCLAQASARAGGPGTVVVVAHSMGGLATRFAAARTVGGRAVADELALVVTIATPESGSYLAGEATAILRRGTPAARSVLGALARAACPRTTAGTATSDPLCELVSEADSPAVRALVPGSPQLAALPPYPASVPVLAIAGDVQLTVDLFDDVAVPLQDGGDLVVDTTSALAAPTSSVPGSGRVSLGCDAPAYEPVGDLHALSGMSAIEQVARAALYAAPPACWHLALPDLPAVQSAVVSGIRARIGASP